MLSAGLLPMSARWERSRAVRPRIRVQARLADCRCTFSQPSYIEPGRLQFGVGDGECSRWGPRAGRNRTSSALLTLAGLVRAGGGTSWPAACSRWPGSSPRQPSHRRRGTPLPVGLAVAPPARLGRRLRCLARCRPKPGLHRWISPTGRCPGQGQIAACSRAVWPETAVGSSQYGTSRGRGDSARRRSCCHCSARIRIRSRMRT